MRYLYGLVTRFWKHAFTFGFNYAYLEFITVVDRKLSLVLHKDLSRGLLKKKEQYIYTWIHSFFADTIADYQVMDADLKSMSNHAEPIWVCWLQGEEKAPSLVKEMLQRLRVNAGGHPVIVVTRDNWREYCVLPEVFWEKYERGLMPQQQFADILRVALLAQAGGLWVDGTMLTLETIPDIVFSLPTFSIKNINSNYFGSQLVTCSDQWQYYFIAAHPGSVTYSFILTCFEKYWTKYDTLIDYFLISYLAKVAREEIPGAKAEYKLVPDNNVQCELLNDFLCKGLPLKDSDVQRFLHSDTWLYKLTWKKPYPLKTKNGEQTLAGYILRPSSSRKNE